MTYFLGIDIGTHESKGVIVDGAGRVIAKAARPHGIVVPRPGWAEHRPEQDWWQDFRILTRTLVNESGVSANGIAAIGCSAIGPCVVPVDRHGTALGNAILYGIDNRAVDEIRDLTNRIGAQTILRRCGNALTTQSVGPKILWLKRNRPRDYDSAHRFVTSTTYLVHKLTGKFVIDHYSAANFSPLYDLGISGWSDELASGIVQLDRLPRVRWTTEIAGEVTGEAAAATGLAVGTPVIAGTIDAASEAVGVGLANAGDMMIMYGSSMFIIMLSDERIADPRLWSAPWLFPGEHASMAGLSTSGTATQWFRRNLAKDLPADVAFAELTAEAAQSPPGARGLVVLPYFSGERTPIHDADARAVIFGLDLTHTRGDLFRALTEGIAYGARHILDTYEELGRTPRRLLAIGGGLRNKVWLQAISDVLGREQDLAVVQQGASYGDAFLAALAIGAVRRDDIARWNPISRTIRPDISSRAVYDRGYQVFRAIYERTRDLMQPT